MFLTRNVSGYGLFIGINSKVKEIMKMKKYVWFCL